MRNYLILLVMIYGVLGEGCGQVWNSKALPEENGELIARIHFAGVAQVNSDPNAAPLSDIMALPAAAPMVDEVMRKLATAPFRIYRSHFADRADDYAAVIRPIVDDLLHAESYVEVRGPTNHVPELVLAVRLDQHRADYWRTNLAAILTAWTGIGVNHMQAEGFQGWELKKHHNPNRIRFFRAGDWVLFGWGQDDLRLQPGVLRRIKSQGRPVSPLKGIWLDAWVDWPAITPYHPSPFPFQLPRMELTLEGKRDYVRPRLVMQFPESLGLRLEPWRIPTNTIRNPFVSFSAIRGVGECLNRLPAAKQFDMGRLPDQYYTWAVAGIPFATCGAAPVADGTNYLKRFGPELVAWIRNYLTAHHVESDLRWTNNQMVLNNFPLLSPSLRATREAAGDFLVGAIFPSHVRGEPMPQDLIHEIMSKPTLVYFGWESSRERLATWRALAQVFLIFSKRPMPDLNAPAQKWLQAVAPRLKQCGTEITLTGPNELTMVRNATIGLSGAELTWLGYWLDAPEFPLNAHHEAAKLPSTHLRSATPSQSAKPAH